MLSKVKTFGDKFYVAEILDKQENGEVVGCVGYHMSDTEETKEFENTVINGNSLPRPFIYCGSLR